MWFGKGRGAIYRTLRIHLMKMSTILTVWSSRSQSISSIHFQTLLQEQPETRSRVRATSNHFFISFLVRVERDRSGRRSGIDDTLLG